MIKTIIFDLGKVIIDYNHARIIERLADRCAETKSAITQKIFSAPLIREYDSGRISSNEFFDRLKEEFQLEMTFEEFKDAWTCTFELAPLFSEELIASLAQKYRLIVLSDTNQLHFDFIEKNFPLMRFFSERVLSFECGFLKPSPEIFRLAIEKAGCQPEECLFTDDREMNVEGAAQLGINSVVFVSTDKFLHDLEKIEA